MVHENEHEFLCEKCDKNFSSELSLLTHIKRIHAGQHITKIPCDTCEKKFFSLWGLNQHIKNEHYNLKSSNQCKFCKKNFKHSANLKMHVDSVYMKSKKFECKLCDKMFRRQKQP